MDAWRGLQFGAFLMRNERQSGYETIKFGDIAELINHRSWPKIEELPDARIYEKPPSTSTEELISFF